MRRGRGKLGACPVCLRWSLWGTLAAAAATAAETRLWPVAAAFGALTCAHLAAFGGRYAVVLRPLDLPAPTVARLVAGRTARFAGGALLPRDRHGLA